MQREPQNEHDHLSAIHLKSCLTRTFWLSGKSVVTIVIDQSQLEHSSITFPFSISQLFEERKEAPAAVAIMRISLTYNFSNT